MSEPDPHNSVFVATIPEFLVTLGLGLPVREEDIHEAYRIRVKTAHPDVGGTREAFQVLEQAYERALEYARFRSGRSKWLGNAIERYAAQQELIEQIERWGGTINTKSNDWLKRSIGEDFAQVLDELSEIRLRGPSISDSVLEVLAEKHKLLSALQTLDLTGSRITDQGLSRIEAIPSLRTLILRNTLITNEGLEVLRNLPNAERVYVGGTQTTWFGRFKLRRALKDVKFSK